MKLVEARTDLNVHTDVIVIVEVLALGARAAADNVGLRTVIGKGEVAAVGATQFRVVAETLTRL